jgi:hypothetical protein
MLNSVFVCEIFLFHSIFYFLPNLIINSVTSSVDFALVFLISLLYYPTILWSCLGRIIDTLLCIVIPITSAAGV